MIRSAAKWALATALVASTGCAGLFGYTSTFTVEMKTRPAVRLRSLTIEPNDAKLVAVGAYDWGAYGEDDRKVLEASVQRSLPAEASIGPNAPELHIVLRRMLISFTNRDGFVFACVTWALKMPDGRFYQEQFYSSRYAVMSTTAGGIKDDIHEAIAERILKTASQLVADPTGVLKPYPAKNTFETYEDAAAGLPDVLTTDNMIAVLALGGGYYQTFTGDSAKGFVRSKDHFDWDAYLAQY